MHLSLGQTYNQNKTANKLVDSMGESSIISLIVKY